MKLSKIVIGILAATAISAGTSRSATPPKQPPSPENTSEFGVSEHDLAILPDAVIANRVDLATNLATIERDANGGNATAASLMALAYEQGWGVPINLQTSAGWAKKASDAGSVPAIAYFSVRLVAGWGMDRDTLKGMSLLSSVAGTPSGDCALAALKLEGVGTPKDKAGAKQLAKRAMAKGLDCGAILFANSIVAEDPTQAFDIYMKLATAGDGSAMARLGLMYESGQGINKDPQQARYFFVKAAENHDFIGSLNGGFYLTKGIEGDVDGARGIAFLQQAADRGSPVAWRLLGLVYFEGVAAKKDWPRAVGFWQRAAAAGDVGGELNLELCYLNGHGIKKNPQEALRWLVKAADQGNAEAMNEIGVGYNNGLLGHKDYAMAQMWLQKAIAAGSEVAQRNLTVTQGNLQHADDPPQMPAIAQVLFSAADAMAAIKSGSSPASTVPVPTFATNGTAQRRPSTQTATANNHVLPSTSSPRSTATPAAVTPSGVAATPPAPVQYHPSYNSTSSWVPAGSGSMNFQVTVQNTGNENLQCFVQVTAMRWNVGSGVAAIQIQSQFSDTATVAPLVNNSDSYSWPALVAGSAGYTVTCHALP